MDKKKKCVIVQFEARHEEILPSLVYACNSIGYRPTVILHRGCKRQRGDIFLQAPSLDAEIIYMPMAAEGAVEKVDKIVADPEVEFVIVGSLSRVKVANWCMSCPKPLICIAHNLDQLRDNPEFIDLLTSGKAGLLLLAPHVAAELSRRNGAEYADRIGVLEPVFWADDIGQSDGEIPEIRKVVIPGAVNTRTRDFAGLLGAVSDESRIGKNLVFQIVSGGRSRPTLEKEVVERGLGQYFEFSALNSSDQVTHSDYFAALRSSDLLHPLVPSDFDKYRAIKITSSLMTSVGFSIPSVIDRWTMFCYRIPGFSSNMPLSDSLALLSEIDQDSIAEMRVSLSQYRVESLEKGASELKRLVGVVSG